MPIRKKTRSIIPFLGLLLAGAMFAQTDVPRIIQRSVAANEADWAAAPDYAWIEDDRMGRDTRSYEVTMILGSPWRRLVKINGMPLSQQEQQKEQRKLDDVRRERASESPAAKARRIASYVRDRKRDQLMMDQLPKAFDFTLSGQQKAGSGDVYVLRAVPRNGYSPPNKEARVLRGMEGELWIDKKTFQWVKVTAKVLHPVSIIGFLARVEPGTSFELEKMPVAEGIWLPKHFSMHSRARILSMITHQTQDDETYHDYRKLSQNQAGQ